MFNGTLVPLTAGFALCGILALVVVFWAERGRLFKAAVVLN
jgi:DHA1 family bicyclomycin/chloramphenicol resistance-like MFS transporter